jgi:hypothetical protein
MGKHPVGCFYRLARVYIVFSDGSAQAAMGALRGGVRF